MIQAMNDVSVIHLEGELNLYQGQHLMSQIKSLVMMDIPNLVLDFEAVEHIHYRCLFDLKTMVHSSMAGFVSIKLANVNPYHEQILQYVGLDKDFEKYPTVADAVLSFNDPWLRPSLMQ